MAEFQVSHPYHTQGLAAGGSALFDAVNRGQVHLAKFLLDAAVSPDVVNMRDFNGKTPLIRCCYVKMPSLPGESSKLYSKFKRSRGQRVNIQTSFWGENVRSYSHFHIGVSVYLDVSGCIVTDTQLVRTCNLSRFDCRDIPVYQMQAKNHIIYKRLEIILDFFFRRRHLNQVNMQQQLKA
ncbi:hypothetical protein HELRODRAFT_169618 [Helobdella robusta]|uniref:Uncharacterized protein n=1 Tax=Helobdella robusta TaxID=6412 RepID=T1F263_HELRO|nr:hypothetical protein HELRODRAFT_169618 [Helobdella robusta]ESO07914.1 hypothetical protein HELRODRAFT_169618 [Helobdella robusta]